MDSQDINKTGYKAKNETEDFINRYINDSAKGWPKICLCGSADAGYRQGRQDEGHNRLRTLFIQ